MREGGKLPGIAVVVVVVMMIAPWEVSSSLGSLLLWKAVLSRFQGWVAGGPRELRQGSWLYIGAVFERLAWDRPQAPEAFQC